MLRKPCLNSLEVGLFGFALDGLYSKEFQLVLTTVDNRQANDGASDTIVDLLEYQGLDAFIKKPFL